MWRNLRLSILLLALGIAAWSTWADRLRTTDWDDLLYIGIFPVDDAGNATTRDYIAHLSPASVADIEQFLRREARRYGIELDRPVSVALYPPLAEAPPERAQDAGVFATMWWSLKLRLYARRAVRASGRPAPQIRIFVRYHDPHFTQSVPHSVGMQKGLVGVVHAYAAAHMTPTNNVVITHEILHTLGASDKYDLATGEPRFPEGYAEPQREPLHPQELAEIMAGRYATSPRDFEMAQSLDEVRVGPATAAEIRWKGL